MSRQVRASAPDPAQWAAMHEPTAAVMLPQKQAAGGELLPLPLQVASLATAGSSTPQASPKDNAAAKAQPMALMTERQQLAFLMRATSEGDEGTASARRKKQQEMDDDEDEESSEDDDDTPLQQQAETGAAAMSDDSENEQAASAASESSSDSSEEDDEPAVPAAVVVAAAASSSSSAAHSKPARTVNTDHLPQPVRRPLEYALWDSARRKAWDGMRTDPNKFYYNYLPPGVTAAQSATGGEAPWTPREKSMFMYSLEGYPPEGQWGLFSLNIPGRTGRECEAFFKMLHKEGLVSGGGVATAASARKPPANQPVKFSAAAALEYKLETTPIVVARALPLPGLASGSSSAREHKEKRARELETAIALLSLLPMPGTVGLKAYTGRESSSSAAKTPATPQPTSRKKQSQQAQASGEERSAEENKENRGQRNAREAGSARASTSSSANQSSRSRATPSTPAPGATPNASKGSSHKHAASGSGAGTDKARNWPASASTDSAAGNDHKQQQRVRAASDALMACMSDIAASTSASRSAAAASSSTASEAASAEDLAPVVGSKRKPASASDADESAAPAEARVPRKRAYTDAAASSAGGSGSGSGAGRSSSGSGSGGSGSGGRGSRELRELLGSSSSPAIAPLYPPHLVGRQVLSTASPQTVPASVDAAAAVAPAETRVSSTPILPFSSFSIPAHTPYSGYSRRAALAHSDSLLRARRTQQPEAAALTPFAAPFFDPFRMQVQEEVPHIDNDTNNLTMRDAVTGENTCAAAFPVAGSAAAGSGGSTEDDDADSATGSFAAELTKLDATFRLRLKRLASHQSQQLARIKRHYGVPEDSAAAGAGSQQQHPNHNTKAAATGLPESGPFGASTHSFAKGCRRTLEEFFNKEMEQEAVPSLVSRCRTYGDAVHEISVSYKTLLKELQREHTTGRDVLLSLKTTGLLR